MFLMAIDSALLVESTESRCGGSSLRREGGGRKDTFGCFHVRCGGRRVKALAREREGGDVVVVECPGPLFRRR